MWVNKGEEETPPFLCPPPAAPHLLHVLVALAHGEHGHRVRSEDDNAPLALLRREARQARRDALRESG